MTYFCGPRIFPKFIKKWLSNRFNLQCKLHDIDYSDKKVIRFDADKNFLQRMVINSENDKDVICAIIFYIAVRIGGKPFKKKEK